MAEVVVKIPDDLTEEFKDVKPVFWQLIVDRTINEELARLRMLKQVVSRSKLTKKDDAATTTTKTSGTKVQRNS